MKDTTRRRLYKRDIVEYIQWGTPLGSVEFYPMDEDYMSVKTEGRIFSLIINDEPVFEGTDRECIYFYNQALNALYRNGSE